MAISGYIKYIIKINFFSFFLLLLIWLLANLKWHMPLHHGSVGRCQPAPKSSQCHFMLQPCIVYRFRFFWFQFSPRRKNCITTAAILSPWWTETKVGGGEKKQVGLQKEMKEWEESPKENQAFSFKKVTADRFGGVK